MLTDRNGNLLAIEESHCTRFLVQIRNGHGTKVPGVHDRIENAISEANELVRFGWSVAIVKRTDILIQTKGQDPPSTRSQK